MPWFVKYIFYCFFWCLIFVLKAAFHFGSFIYRSVSGMWPLSSVNNGSDNSIQFSFTLKFLSHCSIFVYFSDVFTFFLCLFIFSIREYSCNVSQTYLRVQKKKKLLYYLLLYFHPWNWCFSSFLTKKLENFGGFCPLNPYQGFALDPLGGSQHPPDPQLFYVPSACSFFALQKTDAPIFFLYYPLILNTSAIKSIKTSVTTIVKITDRNAAMQNELNCQIIIRKIRAKLFKTFPNFCEILLKQLVWMLWKM